MKKIFAIVLVLILAFSLVACGGTNPPASKGDNQTDLGSSDTTTTQSQAGTAGAAGWSADIPSEVPKYPDGTVDKMVNADTNGTKTNIDIEITGTSRAAFNQYVSTLTDDGWWIDSQKNDTNINFMKSGDSVSIRLYDDGTTVKIFVSVRE